MAKKGSSRVPDCHPDRKHSAHGLCDPCYAKHWQAARSPESKLVQSRAWASANRGKARESNHKYQAANRDALNEKARARRAANPEKCRAENRARRLGKYELARAQYHRRRAALRGLSVPGKVPTREQLASLVAPGETCLYCDVAQATQVDHFVPLARGGLHVIENLVGACRSCNASKGAKLPDVEWTGRKC